MDIMTIVSWSVLVWFCFALGSCYNTPVVLTTVMDSQSADGQLHFELQAKNHAAKPKALEIMTYISPQMKGFLHKQMELGL